MSLAIRIGEAEVPLPERYAQVSVFAESRVEFVGTVRSLLAVPGASDPKNSRSVLCTTVKFDDEQIEVTVYASSDMKVGPRPVAPIPGMAELEDAVAEAVAS